MSADEALMTTIHGFELIREQSLAEINSTARLYRHAGTGAELLSLLNEDENKVFGVSFGTPPADAGGTGVCTTSADCCAGQDLQCINGHCALVPPP